MSASPAINKPNLVAMPPAPIESGRGIFDLPGCTFTPTGLIIKPGLPMNDWVELGKRIKRAGDSLGIYRGDWINYGKHEYGKKYESALALTGLKEGTLRDDVWISKAVPLSDRSDKLTSKHYRMVAPLKTKNKIKLWLKRALTGDWSAARLKREIKKASQPPGAQNPTFNAALKSLHDKAVREDLDGAIADLKKRIEVCPDPILATTYRRAVEMFEWQKARTLENDVAAIVKIFSASEGTEAPERVSEDYISVWLRDHGFIMGDVELEERLTLMVRIRMITVDQRKKSKGDDQRGDVPPVYAPDIDFRDKLDAIDELATRAERVAAMKKDWTQRIARYAPEYVA